MMRIEKRETTSDHQEWWRWFANSYQGQGCFVAAISGLTNISSQVAEESD